MTRIAVIGGGPKTLAALVELAWALERQPIRGSLDIDVFEPHQPGAGAVWRIETPEYLLMNVPADIVDMSSPTFDYSYRQWASTHKDPRARNLYPPRALMGEYLTRAFVEGVLQSKAMRVQHCAESITQINVAHGDRWTLEGAHGKEYGPYAKVLLSTGHYQPVGPQWYRGLEVAPATEASPGVACGEPTTIRGAALTGIDAVLALTVGRNGRFVEDHDGVHTYVPSGREPSAIKLVSRTGVPLAPKPQSVTQSQITAIREAMRALTVVPGSAKFLPNADWWDTLCGAVVAVAPSFGAAITAQEVRRTLFTADVLAPGESAQQRLRAQLDMNHGLTVPDEKWIIGRAWNAGYRSIVESLERKPRDAVEWDTFRAVAARAEKWAFGPPEETVRKLIALADAGILSWQTQRHESQPADVEAVTSPPGVKDVLDGAISDSLWRKLLVEGLCAVRPLERGVLTTRYGQCVNADGSATPGLYALGRPTEDPVVGHDSLNYRLHGDAQRWAEHVLESLTEEA